MSLKRNKILPPVSTARVNTHAQDTALLQTTTSRVSNHGSKYLLVLICAVLGHRYIAAMPRVPYQYPEAGTSVAADKIRERRGGILKELDGVL